MVGTKTGVYVGCFTNDFESVGGRDPCKRRLYKHMIHVVRPKRLILHQVGGPFYAATGYGSRYVRFSSEIIIAWLIFFVACYQIVSLGSLIYVDPALRLIPHARPRFMPCNQTPAPHAAPSPLLQGHTFPSLTTTNHKLEIADSPLVIWLVNHYA